jgi:hypothetical protein
MLFKITFRRKEH